MKKTLIAIAIALAAQSAFGADARYTLKEYSMDGCRACVAALKDVAELTDQGIDVQCFNTDHDPQAAAEARRLNLHLRPAWRLTRADGTEVGRWYNAGRASIIAATIRTYFPPVEEEAASESEEAEAPEVEDAPEQEESDAPLPQIAEEIKDEPEPEPAADFRNRLPVVEPFADAGFLEESQNEWDARGRGDENGGTFREDGEDDAGDALFGRGRLDPSPDCDGGSCPAQPSDAALGDRIADRAARSILQGLTPKLDAAKSEAFKRFDRLGAEATGALEARVSKEFGAARAQLEKKFDGAVSQIKREIVAEIKRRVVKALTACGLILFGIGALIWIDRKWKAGR